MLAKLAGEAAVLQADMPLSPATPVAQVSDLLYFFELRDYYLITFTGALLLAHTHLQPAHTVPTRTRTRSRARTHTHAHARTHKHTHACPHTHARTHACA